MCCSTHDVTKYANVTRLPFHFNYEPNHSTLTDEAYWSREMIPRMKEETLSNIFYLHHKPETSGCTVAVEVRFRSKVKA